MLKDPTLYATRWRLHTTITSKPSSTGTEAKQQTGALPYTGRPGKESLDVSVTMHGSPLDYSSVHFKLYGHELGLEDRQVGSMIIWAKDILTSEAEILTDPCETLKRYCSGKA
ncbi:hypothetical protein NM208_g7920 [Fusarium decemcellulare]|uniref:Uncharacterized protein n=2 Tax=Fusarium decemcellulare TaxID=57161 RepID=A0ACC1RXI1_9HYPO|nr:hypothetical protein NM208_g10674 [Fusarium decemcellulare]KAJ3533590.1 hypothetical protein NM208_g7920 [Fusarium decemcellulare]